MEIQLSDDNNEIFKKVELLKNGEVIKTWTPNSSTPSIAHTLYCSEGEYYYIRIEQNDGDEAIASPIFVRN